MMTNPSVSLSEDFLAPSFLKPKNFNIFCVCVENQSLLNTSDVMLVGSRFRNQSSVTNIIFFFCMHSTPL